MNRARRNLTHLASVDSVDLARRAMLIYKEREVLTQT